MTMPLLYVSAGLLALCAIIGWYAKTQTEKAAQLEVMVEGQQASIDHLLKSRELQGQILDEVEGEKQRIAGINRRLNRKLRNALDTDDCASRNLPPAALGLLTSTPSEDRGDLPPEAPNESNPSP